MTFSIALVGRPNVGKSTLFNKITGAAALAEDKLFATLDPTMRGLTLPGGQRVILSDTVGFISDLPTQLVAAFRATLEEVTGADIICHVRDMANPSHAAQKRQGRDSLAELDVVDRETGYSDIPILEVWNKADLLSADTLTELSEAALGHDAVVMSAASGEGVDALAERIASILTAKARELVVTLPLSDGRRIAWLHAHGDILGEEDAGEGDYGPQRTFTVRLNPKELGQYETL